MRIENSTVYLLSRVPWGYFCTLSHGSQALSRRQRLNGLFRWLREAARVVGVPFRALLWAVRDEAGEINGRLHFHVLLAADGHKPTPNDCFRLMFLWDRHEDPADLKSPLREGRNLAGGIARVRVFDPQGGAVGYMFDSLLSPSGNLSGANRYEVGKFGLTADFLLARAAQEWLVRARRNSVV